VNVKYIHFTASFSLKMNTGQNVRRLQNELLCVLAAECAVKGAITSKIKHAIKLETSPASARLDGMPSLAAS